ncbi:MAG: 3'-5' exonuclease [Candidatus Thiodiazotropha sp.]
MKTEKTKELREGVTYEPGCCLASNNDTDENKSICNPKVPPTIEKIATVKVFFDIETTSLASDCDIVQLSAKHGSSIFDAYIMPSKPISKHASEVTGLTLVNNTLCHKGRQVSAKAPAIGLHEFLSWLDEIGKPVIMYGHNCKVFDCPRLLKHLKTHKLIGAFSEKVIGFVDTLPLCKALFPEFTCYKQEFLISKCTGISYEAHNSRADVCGLYSLIEKVSPVMSVDLNYSFTTKFAVESLAYSLQTEKRMSSLEPLLTKNAISKAMAKKAAGSGLDMSQTRRMALS